MHLHEKRCIKRAGVAGIALRVGMKRLKNFNFSKVMILYESSVYILTFFHHKDGWDGFNESEFRSRYR